VCRRSARSGVVKRVYLDQCVVSHLAGDVPQDWRKTPMGAVLSEASAKGAVEVWASPAHVLETLLCAEYDPTGKVIPGEMTTKRARIARTLLELCEGKRMSASYEFLLVGEFIQLLQQLAPSCVRTVGIFERLKRDNQMIYAGGLGLLAALPEIDRPDAAIPLIRCKLSTRLLHSRFARDPEAFVEELVAVSREFRLTDEDLFAEIDALPLSKLKEEIEANLKTPGKLTPKTRVSLEKNRSEIASAYGAVEIGQCLEAVFGDVLLIMLTFDTGELRRQWDGLCKTLKVSVSMPKEFAVADPVACETDATLAMAGLGQFFRHVARDALLSPQVAHQVILGQLEICLNAGEIPTGGVGFDAEHAAMLAHVNVFVTSDTQLENLAKRAAKKIEKATGGQWLVEVVSNADQLRKALL
jgi:hypothetical protein